MPDEPENLVLMHLRDIRAKLETLDAKVQQVDAKVEKIHGDNEAYRHNITYALGLGTIAGLKADQADQKADDAIARQKTIIANLKKLEDQLAGR